jgi:hypothetical protein
MKSFIRRWLSYSAISAMTGLSVLAPGSTLAEDPSMATPAPSAPYSSGPAGPQYTSQVAPSAEAMFFDGLVYRPLMFVATLLGTGTFIATLPFSILGGNVDAAAQRLVVEPAEATFTECLGCLPGRSFVYGRQ